MSVMLGPTPAWMWMRIRRARGRASLPVPPVLQVLQVLQVPPVLQVLQVLQVPPTPVLMSAKRGCAPPSLPGQGSRVRAV